MEKPVTVHHRVKVPMAPGHLIRSPFLEWKVEEALRELWPLVALEMYRTLVRVHGWGKSTDHITVPDQKHGVLLVQLVALVLLRVVERDHTAVRVDHVDVAVHRVVPGRAVRVLEVAHENLQRVIDALSC